LILFFAGCDGARKPDGMPALHQTTLTFTQAGAPLAEASIRLSSQDPANAMWSSGGMTDGRGVLRVQTDGFDGVPAGTFTVVVSKVVTEGTRIVSEEEGADSGLRSFHVVDAKYRSPATSDLTLEVTSGRNAETFDLGPAVREEVRTYED